MAAALLATSWAYSAYDLPTDWFRLFRISSVELVGFYLCVFLSAEVWISGSPRAGAVIGAVPAGGVLGWLIVAGPLYGWYVPASVILISPLPWAGGWAFIFLLLLFFPWLGPVAAGFLVGLLTHAASSLLCNRRFRDRNALWSAGAHVLGFSVAATIVFRVADATEKKIQAALSATNDWWACAEVLWPIFLGAPAAHLLCFTAVRLGLGWPAGRSSVRRVICICLAGFLAVGCARAVVQGDPSLMITWPTRDFSKFALWKYPPSNAPPTIGDHEIVLAGSANVQRSWSRDARQYKSYLLTERNVTLPLTGAERVHVHIELRKLGRSYVQVICSPGGSYNLLNCREDGSGEGEVRSVPAYWVKYDGEIYAVPGRTDVMIRRSELNLRSTENPEGIIRSDLSLIDSSFPDITILLAASGSELSEWPEALAALNYFVEHHLRPMAK